MTNIWTWVVSGSAGFLGGLVGGTFKWFVPSFADFKAQRRGKADEKLDADIVQLLADGKIWNSVSIATEIGMDREKIIEGLQRLELRGRIQSASGDSNDPGRNYWLNRL